MLMMLQHITISAMEAVTTSARKAIIISMVGATKVPNIICLI